MIPRGAYREKQTFTPGQLAEICRVDTRTIRKWALTGQVHFIETPGGHRRYHRPRLPFLPSEGDPQLLTAEDVAAITGVHPDTVRRWLRHRRLYMPPMPGRLRRVRRSDIDQLIAGNADSHAT